MALQPAGAARRTAQIPRTARAAAKSPFLAPPDIARSEAAAAQAVANFFFRENVQTRSVPAKVRGSCATKRTTLSVL